MWEVLFLLNLCDLLFLFIAVLKCQAEQQMWVWAAAHRLQACVLILSVLPLTGAHAAGVVADNLLHFLQVCPGLWWLEKLSWCQHSYRLL